MFTTLTRALQWRKDLTSPFLVRPFHIAVQGLKLLIAIGSTAIYISGSAVWADSRLEPDSRENSTAEREAKLAEDAARQPMTERGLDRVLETVKFNDTELAKVIDKLRAGSGANIIVNWSALEAGGVEKDAPISLHLKKVSVRTALQLVVEQALSDEIQLSYFVDAGIVRVSTLEDLSRRTSVVVYSVDDLLKWEFGSAGATGRLSTEDNETALSRLSKVVMDVVDPESWENNGGNIGTISTAGGALVIRQSDLNQAEIQRLLDSLRVALIRDDLQPEEARNRIAANDSRDRIHDEETLETRRKLEQIVPRIQFENTTLEAAIERLQTLSGANLVPNWAALESLAIERDAEVSLRLKNISISRLLQRVLDEVSAGEVELDYIVDGSVVRITILEDFCRRRIHRTLNIQELLKTLPPYDGARQPSDTHEDKNGQGPQSKVKHGIDAASAARQFAAKIMAVVDPESWHENGGNVGLISTFGEAIVITQSALAHQRIRQLLDGLRRVQGGESKWELDKSWSQHTAADSASAMAAAAETRRRLGQMVSSIELRNTSIQAAFEKIRSRSGVNLVVNWAALEAHAIEKEDAVNLNLHDMNMEEVLSAVLKSNGEALLAYVIDGETVRVSTLEDLCRRKVVVLYNVSDLVTAAGQGSAAPGGPESDGMSVSQSARDSADLPEGGQETEERESARRRNEVIRLSELIRKSIDHRSWQETGGNIGAITIFGETLAITHSQFGHEAIQKLLDNLRARQHGRKHNR